MAQTRAQTHTRAHTRRTVLIDDNESIYIFGGGGVEWGGGGVEWRGQEVSKEIFPVDPSQIL